MHRKKLNNLKLRLKETRLNRLIKSKFKIINDAEKLWHEKGFHKNIKITRRQVVLTKKYVAKRAYLYEYIKRLEKELEKTEPYSDKSNEIKKVLRKKTEELGVLNNKVKHFVDIVLYVFPELRKKFLDLEMERKGIKQETFFKKRAQSGK
jgi:hypothetical protein